MNEQCLRRDVDHEHKDACGAKVLTLKQQHEDLEQAILDLVDDYVTGLKSPKVYFQFKMYNDPRLNPELYENQK